MPRHLLPLDGSRLAEDAIPHAAAMARSLGAEILLLRVLETDAPAEDATVDSVSWRLSRVEATAYLGGWKARLEEAGFSVEVEVREGRAAEQVIEAAREHGADLVVLASHGAGGLEEFGLGGTAQRVIAWGSTSFLLVRAAGADGSLALDLRYRSVLVPVDGSNRADWALHTAAAIAKAQGSRLVLAHVVPVPDLPGRTPPTPEDLELRDRVVARNREQAEAFLEDARTRLSAGDLDVATRLVVSPAVHRRVATVSAEEGAELVVLGAHGSGCAGGTSAWPYGSVATGLISHLAAPLLVLQDLPRRASVPAVAEAARSGSEPAPQG